MTISFSMLGKFSTIIPSKIFSYPLFSLLLGPLFSNVGVFNMVPESSESILSSFHSFYCILLFSSYFHHFIFQLTDLFFASDILLRIPSATAATAKSLRSCPTLCDPIDSSPPGSPVPGLRPPIFILFCIVRQQEPGKTAVPCSLILAVMFHRLCDILLVRI